MTAQDTAVPLAPENLAQHTQQYSAEAVQEILAIALGNSDSFSSTHLQEMAHDLSIGDVALRDAVEVWQAHQAKARNQRRQRHLFYRQKLLPYVVVNTFLILLNISLSGTITWAIYPLLGWGLSLFLEPCKNKPIRQSSL